MSTDELQRIVGKAHKLGELHRARERVRQLERELRGEPARPEEPTHIPEFLTHEIVRSVHGPRVGTRSLPEEGSPGISQLR